MKENLHQGNGLSNPVHIVIGTGTSHKIAALGSLLGDQFNCVPMNDPKILGQVEQHIHSFADHECLQPLVALSKVLFIPDKANIKIAGDVAMYGKQNGTLKPWHQPGSPGELLKQAKLHFSHEAAVELGPHGDKLIPIRCQLSVAILSHCVNHSMPHVDVIVEKKRLLLKPFSDQEIEEYVQKYPNAQKSNGGFLIQTPEMQSHVVADGCGRKLEASTSQSIAQIKQLLLGAPSAENIGPILHNIVTIQPHAFLASSVEYLSNVLHSTGLRREFGNPAPTMFQIHQERSLKRRFA